MNGHGHKTEFKELPEFGRCSQAQGGISEVSCAGPGIGLHDPLGSLAAQDNSVIL